MTDDTELQNMRGMADCMDMVRQELIEAEIITADIAPMFIANAVVSDRHALLAAIAAARNNADDWQLRALLKEKETEHWKANHADQVARARVLIERTDMPLERVKAYELIGRLQEELEMLKLEAARWNACIHAAKDMDGEDLEHEFVLAVDKYMGDHGL